MTDEARTAEAASPSGSVQRIPSYLWSVSISVFVSAHVQFLFVSAREQSVISVPMQKQQQITKKCEWSRAGAEYSQLAPNSTPCGLRSICANKTLELATCVELY